MYTDKHGFNMKVPDRSGRDVNCVTHFCSSAEKFVADEPVFQAPEVRGILLVSEDFSNAEDRLISHKRSQLKMRNTCFLEAKR